MSACRIRSRRLIENAAIFDRAIESDFMPGRDPPVLLSIKQAFDPIALRALVIDGTGHWVTTCIQALEAEGYDVSDVRRDLVLNRT